MHILQSISNTRFMDLPPTLSEAPGIRTSLRSPCTLPFTVHDRSPSASSGPLGFIVTALIETLFALENYHYEI
jgi:hypothetical protein